MQRIMIIFSVLLTYVSAIEEIFYPSNASRSRTTLSGIAEYRAALTLDWLAAEDTRQRELALAFETESAPIVRVITSDCINYPRPATGKIGRLMLELLKNLEGDEGHLIPELVQALLRAKLLIETSMLEAEPDLESLVKTPDVMMGEPHTTFPRLLALVWMTATDPTAVNSNGWCSINKVTKYLGMSSPSHTARYMRDLDPIIARARFVMEEFIQHVTPSMYTKTGVLEHGVTFANKHPATRTNYRDRVKMRQNWPTSLNITPQRTTTTRRGPPYVQKDYEEHLRMVGSPIEDDEKDSSSVKVSRSVTLSEWAVIALCLVVVM